MFGILYYGFIIFIGIIVLRTAVSWLESDEIRASRVAARQDQPSSTAGGAPDFVAAYKACDSAAADVGFVSAGAPDLRCSVPAFGGSD